RTRVLFRAECKGSFPRCVDWRVHHRVIVEGRIGRVLLVHVRHVAVHTRERINCRRRRFSGVGLSAGGDSAVRRGVHGRVCAVTAWAARASAGRANSSKVGFRLWALGFRGFRYSLSRYFLSLLGRALAKAESLKPKAYFVSALMMASLNIGTSSGFLEVMRLPSSTTGLST